MKTTISTGWLLPKAGLIRMGVLMGVLTTGQAAGAPPDVQGAAVRLPAQRLAELRRDVTRARAIDPGSFAAVSVIVTRAPEAARRARGRSAPTASDIARLGSSAVLPTLEMLALDPPHGVPAEAAPMVRRDLVEAVGLLRDPRGLPVVSAILDDESEGTETTRTAAEAVARIGTEEAATKLLSALDLTRAERARAVVAGMGECRHLRVTEAIAAVLRTTTDEPMARIAARSLGRAGNAWAWRTMKDRSSETPIRETAARALLDAYLRHDGEARDAASNALMVVDAPQTPALIAEAKRTASPPGVEALDALAVRFARNPTRTR